MSLRSKLDLLNDPYIYKFKGSITYKNGILPLESRLSAKNEPLKDSLRFFIKYVKLLCHVEFFAKSLY